MPSESNKIANFDRRLCLGPVAHFDPAFDIAAGPWCFASEAYADSWHQMPSQPDPFITEEQRKDAEARALAEAERLLPALAVELNRRNDVKHPLSFWRVMLMPWLLTLIQVLLDRQSRAANLIERYGRQAVLTTRYVQFATWNFEDTEDFFDRGVFDPTFNSWLLGELLAARAPADWQFEEIGLPSFKLPARKAANLGRRLKEIFNTYLQPARVSGVYGLNISERYALSWLLHVAPTKPSSSDAYEADTDNPGAQDWWVDISQLLETCLPRYFKQLSTWAPPPPSTCLGKSAILANTFYEERQKYRAAWRMSHGERVYSAQHGGNYGNARNFSLVDGTEYRMSGFLSWGWTRHGGYPLQAVPLSSPYLSKFRRSKHPSNEMILVGTRLHAYCYRLDSMPQPGGQSDYATRKLRFVNSLSESARKPLTYRSYPWHLGCFDDRQFMKQHLPDMKFCDGPLHPRLLAAAFVVLDHPGTTLNICLAADVPVVCFWSAKDWAMTDEANVLFDQLREAGILFETPEEAARCVNTISNNPALWWSSNSVRSAREKWAFRYARTSPRWRREWLRTVKTL